VPRRRGASRSAVAEPRLLLAPAWLWYAAFFVVPFGFLVAYSLAVNDPERFFVVQFGVNSDQFQRIWDPIYLDVYKDTFVMAITGTIG
jgi:ABC-type spermidine/putrescine transport system permease subunit I